MTGKRHTVQKFGGFRAILGAPVFVNDDGYLVAGHVVFIRHDDEPLIGLPGWDVPSEAACRALPFYDAQTREQADAMPAGHWCWPRTWMEEA